jgi:hypothetical protein
LDQQEVVGAAVLELLVGGHLEDLSRARGLERMRGWTSMLGRCGLRLWGGGGEDR